VGLPDAYRIQMPSLGPQPTGRIPAVLKNLKRCRVDLPCLFGGGSGGMKTTVVVTGHDSFGQQIPRRIPPPYEKHEKPIHRAFPHCAIGVERRTTSGRSD
jgi:hypothetical protein